MGIYRLDTLFRPTSIAVAGASPRPGSLGGAVLANLTSGGFPGRIFALNPKYAAIGATPCHAALGDLPCCPDLLIIATPASSIVPLLDEAAKAGVPAAIVISARDAKGREAQDKAVRGIVRSHGLRVVGPNCFGVIAPHARMDASFAARPVTAGSLALVSQSGAIAAAMIEWAGWRGIGFSGIVSLGDQLDVDFGDCLDYFAADAQTRAILLYVEAVGDARKFMASARAAARLKPVIVLKAGRHAQAASAARSHTGALAGSDIVYDAAFRRAGLVRAIDLPDLIAAAGALTFATPFVGDRTMVVTNGGGLGVLAIDRLLDMGLGVATPAAETLARLDGVLPTGWSHGNPIDIIGDAGAERYEAAVSAALDDPATDALLVMNCPTALVDVRQAAQAGVRAVEAHRKASGRRTPVLAVWLDGQEETRDIFARAGIPTFATEADAARGLSHLVAYRRGQERLGTSPGPGAGFDRAGLEKARQAIGTAIAEGRRWLDPFEVQAVLDACAIPVVATARAATGEEATSLARALLRDHQGVALKVLSPDIQHKSDVDGVRLGLSTPQAVREAADDIMARARRLRPDARIEGVMLQPMIHRSGALELIAGIGDDPTFGPVILFGAGGIAVETVRDTALALPPLDRAGARDLIGQTRIARLMAGYRSVPPVAAGAVEDLLIRLSRLAADLPEVRELDLNPLLADSSGLIALDARIAVAPVRARAAGAHPRFAIRPYPSELEGLETTRTGRILRIRPVRAEDDALYAAFFPHVEQQDLRQRFFAAVPAATPALIAKLTLIDYARSMVLVGLDEPGGAMLGAVRLHADADHHSGEFAIIVRSDLKAQGIGWVLMQRIIAFARAEGLATVHGQVLRTNAAMLALCRELGFVASPDPADGTLILVRLDLGS